MIWIGALLSGLLFCLTMPPMNWGILAFVAWIPLLFIWMRSSPLGIKKGLGVGVVFGLVPFLYTHQWMLVLTPWAPLGWLSLVWGLFSAYQALFPAVAIGLFEAIRHRWSSTNWSVWPVFICIWVIMEWVRSLGVVGSTSASVGMAMIHIPIVLQWASIGGIWLLSAMVLGVQLLAVLCLEKPRFWGVLLVLVLIIIGGGAYRLHTAGIPTLKNPALTMSVIQGNHPQMDKLSGNAFDDILLTYLTYTRIAASQGAQVVIWPETVTPYFNLEDRVWTSSLQRLSTDTRTTILYGTPVRELGRNYNAIAGVTPTGSFQKQYLKRHLMPFGEYWPMRHILAQLGLEKVIGTGEYSPGPQTTLLRLPHVAIGGAICLESLYPSQIRRSVNSGADVIVVVANNAWFFNSIAAELHFQHAIMRAVESQRYVVQCANTGISGIITPTGHVLKVSKLNERTALTGTVYTGYSQSVYDRVGDWVIWLSLFIVCMVLIWKIKKIFG